MSSLIEERPKNMTSGISTMAGYVCTPEVPIKKPIFVVALRYVSLLICKGL
jgi:hypothetical protein